MAFESDIADIHAAFAETISYNGATIRAVPGEEPAPDFQGAGVSAQRRWFEVRQADLPAAPVRGDRIVAASVTWSVINVRRRDDVAAWDVTVERTWP